MGTYAFCWNFTSLFNWFEGFCVRTNTEDVLVQWLFHLKWKKIIGIKQLKKKIIKKKNSSKWNKFVKSKKKSDRWRRPSVQLGIHGLLYRGTENSFQFVLYLKPVQISKKCFNIIWTTYKDVHEFLSFWYTGFRHKKMEKSSPSIYRE